jgi:uncharacterized protein (DUF1800 family)
MSERVTLVLDASTALRRFGLGPKFGDIVRISGDPRGFVLAALADPSAARIPDSVDLEPSHFVFAALEDAKLERAVARAFMPGQPLKPGEPAPPPLMFPSATLRRAAPPVMASPEAPTVTSPTMAASAGSTVGQVRREAFRDEAFARIARAISTTTPFLERLVQFWSNHFCVSTTKGSVRALAGSYEREAIRPHVLGRFCDMLKAVEQHPAMLIYLDNAHSIGPNSKAGQNRTRGLNENLAREILELHTLGVDGGYTQADVTNLARVITGWTFGQGDKIAAADRGRFLFAPHRHEPGVFPILAKPYDQSGQLSGESVLADLARHPKTARHIALKFARHFVSDAPPLPLVAALEKTFRDTDGNLAALARTLVASPLAWEAPAAKIVPPYDFVVSLVRGFDLKMQPGEVNRLAAVLGQPLWQVGSPKGWPDADDSWMGPSPIRERLRIAEKVAKDVPRGLDPRAVLVDLVGAGVSEHTKLAIARAETREQAFELMIMSPDFMRR